MKVNILGTEYTIFVDSGDCPELEGCMGYCKYDAKEIHVIDLDTDEEWKAESEAVKINRTKIILRHEIIHAFLSESGLHHNTMKTSAWAVNEEMIDWFAIQAPKIYKAFEQCDCL